MSAKPVGKTADLLVFQVNATAITRSRSAPTIRALRIPDSPPGSGGIATPIGQQIVFRKDRIEVTSPTRISR